MNSYIPDYEKFEDKRVVLLQSGGLDSNICASILNKCGFEIHHLFVNYGQNTALKEFHAVSKIVNCYGGTLHSCKLNAEWLNDVALAKGDIKDTDAEGQFNTIDTGVYVPLRNAFLLSLAGSLAEKLQIPYICAALDGLEDLDGYPCSGTTDKHPTFVKRMENALTEGSMLYHINDKSFTILTPLMGKYKDDIVRIGIEYGADMSLSWSCYNSQDKPCGVCSACVARKQGFDKAGIKDPLFE